MADPFTKSVVALRERMESALETITDQIRDLEDLHEHTKAQAKKLEQLNERFEKLEAAISSLEDIENDLDS